jgi:hypothetical protein
MITIYFQDGTVQGINPSPDKFEYSGHNVKLLVEAIALGRPFKYYVDSVKDRRPNK